MGINTFHLGVIALLLTLFGLVALNNDFPYYAVGFFMISMPAYITAAWRFIKEIKDVIQDKRGK